MLNIYNYLLQDSHYIRKKTFRTDHVQFISNFIFMFAVPRSFSLFFSNKISLYFLDDKSGPSQGVEQEPGLVHGGCNLYIYE